MTYTNQVWLEIDRKKISMNDIGEYKIVFDLRDDKYPRSYQKSIYTVEFRVDYVLPKNAEDATAVSNE